jgi:hypothetical protein
MDDWAYNDNGYDPPVVPVSVRCYVCGEAYTSDRMVFEERFGEDELWRCPTDQCDGVGFGYDVLPTSDEGF